MLLYRRLYSLTLIALIITGAALFAVYVKFDSVNAEGQFQLIQSAESKQQKQVQQQTTKQTEQQNTGQVLTVQESKVSTKSYFYGSSLVASKSNGAMTYYHKDYLGSVRLQSSAGAQKAFSSRAAPFGSDVYVNGNQIGSENAYKFTGQGQDSGLYYYGARYYDTAIGRFTQLDPAPSSESPYAYVSNNPLAFSDPRGAARLYMPLPENFHVTTKEDVKAAWNSLLLSSSGLGDPLGRGRFALACLGFCGTAMSYADPAGIFGMANPISVEGRLAVSTIPDLYKSGELVGTGSYGSIRRIGELAVKRSMAAKMLEYEHEVLTAVHSDILPQAYAFSKEGRAGYLFKEFIPGSAYESSSVSKEQILRFARKLGEVEAQGFILRDIKPANLVITEEGEIRMIDFLAVKANGMAPETAAEYRLVTNLQTTAVAGGKAEFDEILDAYYRGLNAEP